MKTLLAALIAVLMPMSALANECAVMKDSRHVYEYNAKGELTAVDGDKSCRAVFVKDFNDDPKQDTAVTCDNGVSLFLIYYNGGFYSLENGREERLVCA